ncbi:MAG: thiamine-phosphate kinase [Nevskiaceae bacterium]|nr:MAG: thiamine-phosphate kinase [Nevskiaceae bacterium]
MDEFQLIRRYFQPLGAASADVALGIGDDCALLQVPPGEELAVTTDTLVAGRHFPLQTAACDIGWKALAVNLSDLAAMGAMARWVTLALTLPENDAEWLTGFCAGFGALLHASGVALVGGDTTRGPLSITVTALGSAPAGRAMRRSGAQPGDLVCVTGALGDAALALRRLGEPDLPPALRERLDRPQPRLAAGLTLRQYAHAAIDISDGLAGDLGHLLDASGVGAELEAASLPQSYAFARHAMPPAERTALQLHGGDDYELCVCLPPDRLEAAQGRLDVPLTAVGRIVAEPGLRLTGADGVTMPIPPHGYRHFT